MVGAGFPEGWIGHQSCPSSHGRGIPESGRRSQGAGAARSRGDATLGSALSLLFNLSAC